MPLAERMDAVKASRAARSHATMLGHMLAHEVAVVKISNNTKSFCVSLADVVSAGLVFTSAGADVTRLLVLDGLLALIGRKRHFLPLFIGAGLFLALMAFALRSLAVALIARSLFGIR
jgi:hypothetical protein